MTRLAEQGRTKKELQREMLQLSELIWRPQGDSNPRYRRESRKILKHQTVVVVRVSRFSFSFKRIQSYGNCVYYIDYAFSV